MIKEVVCKEFSPQINKMLVEYALEKGVKVFYKTKIKLGYPEGNFTNIVFNGEEIVRGYDTCDRKELSVGEFLSFIDELANPKIKIAGYDVLFSDNQIKVGCTVITHSEVKEFFKEYQKQFGDIK